MKFIPAVMTALGTACLVLTSAQPAQAQFKTPTVDGVISIGEYDNAYRSPSGTAPNQDPNLTWHMTWNQANLFVAISDARLAEGAVIYLDLDPQTIVNAPGNGTTQGLPEGYDGSTGTLPFQADAVLYVKSGYREIRTFNRETGQWRAPVVSAGEYAQVGTEARDQPRVREFSIPWATINGTAGLPANFNWLGYVAIAGGGAYGQVPVANPKGNIGANANFVRYFTVLNTAAGSASNAFGPNGLDSYSHSGSSINNFGGLNVYDFTLNTPGALITRIGTSSAWSVQGNLRVANGTLNLGESPSPVTVAGGIRIFDGGIFRYVNPVGDLIVSGNLEFNSEAAFDVTAAVTLTGNNDQTISGGTYRSLTIQGNGIKTLSNNNLTVTNSLVLTRGTLVTGPYLVDLGTTGGLQEPAPSDAGPAGGYILGTVTSTRTITGPRSDNFGGIGLTIISPNNALGRPGTVLVQRITDGFGIDASAPVATANKTIRRRFFIAASNPQPIDVSLVFGYRNGNPDELEGNGPNNLVLYQSSERTFNYRPVPGGTNTPSQQNRNLTFSGTLALQGYFSLADGRSPLPVELISFTGKNENNAVRLNWVTASEKQNKGFEVERRSNQGDWKVLGFVAGNGTTNQRNNYTYVDRSTATGNIYYRLRQIDLDGKSVYSQPITVQMGPVAFTLSPVPATDVLTLNGLGAGNHTAEIYNTRGQRVLNQTFSDAAATSLTVSTLPAGVYMVRVLGPDQSVRQARFIKQ
jgi:hypothetical protein